MCLMIWWVIFLRFHHKECTVASMSVLFSPLLLSGNSDLSSKGLSRLPYKKILIKTDSYLSNKSSQNGRLYNSKYSYLKNVSHCRTLQSERWLQNCTTQRPCWAVRVRTSMYVGNVVSLHSLEKTIREGDANTLDSSSFLPRGGILQTWAP